MGDTHLSVAAVKANLRRRISAARKCLPNNDRRHAARRAAAILFGSRLLRKEFRVAVYLTHGSELDTAPLIERLHQNGIRVYAPVIKSGDRMMFVRIKKGQALQRTPLKVPQPTAHRPVCRASNLHVIILPLIAFDRAGNRLGQGGGHYDRALGSIRSRRRPLRLGFAYRMQQVESIPPEPWDLPLDGVVTERGLLRFRRRDRRSTGAP